MSRKIRMGLMVAGLLVFIVVCWFFLLSPLRGKIADADAAIETERNSLSQAQFSLAQAETTRQEGKRNQARLLELAKMVPPSEELPSLLLQIQDLADQSGIDFIAITPGDATGQGDSKSYIVLPLDLQFTGTFFDVSDFAYRAEQMVAGPGRLLAIKSLDLQSSAAVEAALSSGSVSPQLSVSISMYAFIATGSSAASSASGSKSSSGSSSSSSTTGGTSPQ